MAAPDHIELIVGLGNPGDGHAGDRHNAGFWLLDRLAEVEGLSWRDESRYRGLLTRTADGIRLLKPQTFMNLSGESAAACAHYFRIPPSAVLVVHDELDLAPGLVRLKQGGGHGGHNGLRNLDQHLGSSDYARIRLGIGHPGNAREVSNYVLGAPPAGERDAIHEAIESAIKCLPEIVGGRFDRAMNKLNRKQKPPEGTR